MNITTNDNEKLALALTGLYDVDDPEIGLNIVDLGLVYHLEFEEEPKKLEITMTLTTRFCPMGESIQSNVRDSLEERFPSWEVNINLTFVPAWDTTMISPEGQEFLGYI